MQVLHETRVYFGSTCKRFEGKKRKKKKGRNKVSRFGELVDDFPVRRVTVNII